MKMAFQDGHLRIREMTDEQYQILRSLGRFKWNKTTKELSGIVDLDTLNRLSNIITLPEPVEAYRKELISSQVVVNKLRLEEAPKPLIKPPIKEGIKPYAHQIRGYNMALVVFGLVEPKEALEAAE